MKVTSILLFIFTSSIFAVDVYSQVAKVSIKVEDMQIEKLLATIENQTEYLFIYSKNEVDVNRRVSMKANNESVAVVLNTLFGNTDIVYAMEGNNIMLIKSEKKEIVQQKNKVTGIVRDEDGLPLIGATIVVKGLSVGTTVDENGAFSMEVPENGTIIITFMGYITQEIRVMNFKDLLITLKEDVKKLEEVVVTALGIKRSEKGLGYALQKIDGDHINMVKGVDATSGLIGKIAGLNVQSSTEFNQAPSISLRGESPLLVVDGVPSKNVSMRDIAPDDIENITILKGATATALYGSDGGSGAIMIVTKRGHKKKGLQVSINSNTMFEAGHLVLPEVQTSYSSGSASKYGVGDFVWGDRLDIGRMAEQYNPKTYKMEMKELTSKGRNNLGNFLEPGFITNNNVNVSSRGENGGFRTSLTHVYNEGQYPNSKLNKITYTMGGDISVDKFSFEGNVTYNKRFYPNNSGTGYAPGGYIYNLLVWTGPEYDIRDYKNYWVEGKEDVQQNWMDDRWYDNPYFIANEKRKSDDYDVTNGFLSAKYEILPWLNATVRSGFDYTSDTEEWKYAQSLISHKKGYYSERKATSFSINNDFLLMGNYMFGKLGIDAMVGGTINYRESSRIWGATNNGLSIPGFYSIYASVDPASTGQDGSKKQKNSLFGKATFSWGSMLFVDITGRNDWSSTLPESTRSFFYPSVSTSLIVSEIIKMPAWVDLLKVRASWTKSKEDLSIYDTNNTYSITINKWDGLNAGYFPGTIRGIDLNPVVSTSFEIGTAGYFLKNRFRFDFTYYNKLTSDYAVKANISPASGYSSVFINSEEEIRRHGVEISIGGTPIKSNDFQWDTSFNWSLHRRVYNKLDPKYSSKYPWVKKGERADVATTSRAETWDTDDKGNIVHGANGLPVIIPYTEKMGYSSPDWIWGFSNTFAYKDFTLNVSFDGSVGGVAYNRTEQAMWNSGSHIKSDNQWRYDEVVDGKKNYIGAGVKVVSGTIERDEYGTVLSDNRVYVTNDTEVSYENYIRNYQIDSYISVPQNFFDKTYFKLREVSLNYNIPSVYANKLGMTNCSVAVVGNNLLLWTKEFKYSDPDKGSDDLNSPSIRYLGFNVKLSF